MISRLLMPIFIQILAIAVIIAEFIVPSAGLLTIAAIGLFGYSLYIVFTSISIATGFIFLAFDLILAPFLVILGIRILAASPVTLRATLGGNDRATSQPEEWLDLKGSFGTALTDLHPAGTALIEGKRRDVISRGEYIGKGTAIEVIAVEGNRILVKTHDVVDQSEENDRTAK